MIWRPRLALGAGLVGALLGVAVWAGVGAVSLRSGPVAAFNHISSGGTSTPASATPNSPQASRPQSPAPVKAATVSAPTHVASATCAPWRNSLTLGSFKAVSSTPGSSVTVKVMWSAFDHCPPYTGTIREIYTRPGDVYLVEYYPIAALTGTRQESFDCTAKITVTGISYQLNLWDGTNHMVWANTSAAAC